MKKITKNSAEKKLEALSLNKSSIVYKLIREVIEGSKSIRPCYSTGSGRWTRNQDCTVLLDIAFRKIGIEYTMSNDSPRGGATGKLITIVTKIK